MNTKRKNRVAKAKARHKQQRRNRTNRQETIDTLIRLRDKHALIAKAIDPTFKKWPWQKDGTPVNFEEYPIALKLADWAATKPWWDSKISEDSGLTYKDAYTQICIDVANKEINGEAFVHSIIATVEKQIGVRN